MKKEEIRRNNTIVEKAMEKFERYFCGNIRHWTNEEIKVGCHLYGNQLLRCSATVYDTPKYYVLVSYKTIVAFINKDESTLYDVLRRTYGYTATSAQHISKFANIHKLNNVYRWYPL